MFQRGLRHWTLSADGHSIELTDLEFRLLYYLMKNAGRILNTSQIMRDVWGYDYEGESTSLPAYIRRLRSKVRKNRVNPSRHHAVRANLQPKTNLNARWLSGGRFILLDICGTRRCSLVLTHLRIIWSDSCLFRTTIIVNR